MSATNSLVSQSVHRVSNRWRWFTVVAVPLLVALMAWGAVEIFRNNLDEDGSTELWALAFAIVVLGGVAIGLIGTLIWAFRARAIIDGDQMTIRGAFMTTTFTPDRMEGFQYLNDQLNVYLTGRHFAVEIAYFENLWAITQWVQENTYDILADMLEEEELAISNDVDLGMTDEAKSESLKSLRKWIVCANTLIYFATGTVFVNFLFFENIRVEQGSITILVMTPILLYLFAIMNLGQIRIDQEEGSRYPEIFTALMTCGISLAFLSLFDRGALLDNSFYESLIVAILVNGLIWCLIDARRLTVLWARGRAAAVVTAIAYFGMSGFWSGGFLYQANKLLDDSPTKWHATEIVEKVSSGKTIIYSVKLAPWDTSHDEPVEYTLRRGEFESFEEGMPVLIGVRTGALNMAWASALERQVSSSLLVGTDEKVPDEPAREIQ